ncbi:GntR family transcriptional regulator [Streptomyces sp. UNOB3_S3]|uniref:GntR family transcriptional regulator n=1 Tax=Streptomyces sp. UNOB3_S3 TaxID=2871682 RepID=UPI001E2F1A9A|nr:GntR family transcriptional regulator [Streptomyces sp. UNOB3_S3]MCC3775359.1 GntR family transcriptional regulator [Streptomyces sp. UNOB3_S3]
MTRLSPRGTYLRIASALRQRLGAEAEQRSIPSEAALMDEFGVARTTVRRALQTLAAEGLIESRPGVGWQLREGRATPPLVDRIRAALAEGGFEVGSTFCSEASLCERFQTSRTSVRRALAQLEGEGMLEAVHGKGRLVKALPPAPEGS